MFTMETSELNKPENQYHHGDLRNALIQAGLLVLSEAGVDGLNLRAVARRAGVSHAAPYRHFADKEALLAAMAEDGFQRLGQQISEALATTEGNWTKKIHVLGTGYIRFAVENRDAFRLMFSHVIAHRERHPALYVAAKSGLWALQRVIEAGQIAGEFVDSDVSSLTISVWSMVHGVATLLVEDQLAPMADRLQTADWRTQVIDFHMALVTASVQKKG